jgi:hypothetical protein
MTPVFLTTMPDSSDGRLLLQFQIVLNRASPGPKTLTCRWIAETDTGSVAVTLRY